MQTTYKESAYMIIGFIGDMRSGKTLMMTLKAYQDHLKGTPILSNYGLTFPHEKININLVTKSVTDKNTDYFKNSTVCIDEIHIWIDSRVSGQKRNRLISYFITQSGKLNTTVLWTSQFLRQVDVRLRLNTQILYKTRRFIYEKGEKRFLRQDDKREDFKILVERYKMAELRSSFGFVHEKSFVYNNPNQIFSLYDTTEKIQLEGDIHEEKK
jgi:hypothetical protein